MLKRSILLLLLVNGMSLIAMESRDPNIVQYGDFAERESWRQWREKQDKLREEESDFIIEYHRKLSKMPTSWPSFYAINKPNQLKEIVGKDFAQKYLKLPNLINSENKTAMIGIELSGYSESKKESLKKEYRERAAVLERAVKEIIAEQRARL